MRCDRPQSLRDECKCVQAPQKLIEAAMASLNTGDITGRYVVGRTYTAVEVARAARRAAQPIRGESTPRARFQVLCDVSPFAAYRHVALSAGHHRLVKKAFDAGYFRSRFVAFKPPGLTTSRGQHVN